MKLTGKALEDFQEYLHIKGIEYDLNMESYPKCFLVENFSRVPESMQWGVYVDFFDSKDLRIFISDNIQSHAFKGSYSERLKLARYGYEVQHDNNGSFYHKTIQEARKAAIEKANEIYNSL